MPFFSRSKTGNARMTPEKGVMKKKVSTIGTNLFVRREKRGPQPGGRIKGRSTLNGKGVRSYQE